MMNFVFAFRCLMQLGFSSTRLGRTLYHISRNFYWLFFQVAIRPLSYSTWVIYCLAFQDYLVCFAIVFLDSRVSFSWLARPISHLVIRWPINLLTQFRRQCELFNKCLRKMVFLLFFLQGQLISQYRHKKIRERSGKVSWRVHGAYCVYNSMEATANRE